MKFVKTEFKADRAPKLEHILKSDRRPFYDRFSNFSISLNLLDFCNVADMTITAIIQNLNRLVFNTTINDNLKLRAVSFLRLDLFLTCV